MMQGSDGGGTSFSLFREKKNMKLVGQGCGADLEGVERGKEYDQNELNEKQILN